MLLDVLLLQATEEGLGYSVVPTVSPPAYAPLQMICRNAAMYHCHAEYVDLNGSARVEGVDIVRLLATASRTNYRWTVGLVAEPTIFLEKKASGYIFQKIYPDTLANNVPDGWKMRAQGRRWKGT